MLRIIQCAVVLEVVGDFRYDRENRKTCAVADLVPRVKKALNQQEAKNRKGEPSEVTHQTVQGQLIPSGLKQNDIMVDKMTADVVDDH